MDCQIDIKCELCKDKILNRLDEIKEFCTSSRLNMNLESEIEFESSGNELCLTIYDDNNELYQAICAFLAGLGGQNIEVLEESEYGSQTFTYSEGQLLLSESSPMEMLDDDEETKDQETAKSNGKFLKGSFAGYHLEPKLAEDICFSAKIFNSYENQISQLIKTLEQESKKKNGFNQEYFVSQKLGGKVSGQDYPTRITIEVSAFSADGYNAYFLNLETDCNSARQFKDVCDELNKYFGSERQEIIKGDFLVSHKISKVSEGRYFHIALKLDINNRFCSLDYEMTEEDYDSAVRDLSSSHTQVIFDYHEDIIKSYVGRNPDVWTYRLGMLYLYAQNKFKLPRRAALNSFMAAANNGHLQSQLIAARDLYQHKDKDPSFLNLSIKYLELAANQGNVSALERLEAYRNGEKHIEWIDLRM